MFRKLLVPLDGTPEAAAALPAAQTLAHATGAAITLLRVTAGRPEDTVEARHVTEQAEDALRATAEELTNAGLSVNWLVRTAPIAASIIEAALVSNADVIVMATHGRTGLTRAFAGSVSERVVADSGRPVLLLKPDGKRLDSIATLLVPLDGTAGGVLGLGAAVGLARATGARLILLDVVPPMPLWMYGGEVGLAMTYVDPAWEEEALHSAETYIRGLAERLRKSGLQVETRALRSEVAAAIHDVADETNADVVVMSTHGSTGPARAMLGSVADAVVRTSHRPVLLIRRPAGTLDDGPDNTSERSVDVVTAGAASQLVAANGGQRS
jgi:nucleotide-binding universal stress UspA family protein